MRSKVGIIMLFAAIAIWFTWLNWYPGFKDGDGFYHTKMVEWMRDDGLVRAFPWLPLTTLNDHFADHHMLYHALAVPFARIMPSLLALKIVSVALGLLVVIQLYALMKRLKIPSAELMIALLALHPYFILRATMTKGSGAAMLVQFAIFACVLFRERLAVFLLSMMYVWTHGGFPFAVILVGAMLVAKVFVRSAEGRKLREVMREVWSTDWLMLAAAVGGIALGIVVNPYFPDNLYFYWHQVVQAAVVGIPKGITVGAEWYGIDMKELLFVTLPLLASLMIPLGAVIIMKRIPGWHREQAERLMFMMLVTMATGVMMLRANRHAEYFIPYCTILIGEVHRIILPLIEWKRVREICRAWLSSPWLRRSAYLACALLALVPLFELRYTAKMLRDNVMRWDRSRGVADYLKTNTEPGEIVFEGNWDYFPELMYWNDHNRYVSGLDTRFLYGKNPELAKAYQERDVKKQSVKALFDAFPVKAIVIQQAIRGDVYEALMSDKQNFEKRYEDDWATIFVKK